MSIWLILPPPFSSMCGPIGSAIWHRYPDPSTCRWVCCRSRGGPRWKTLVTLLPREVVIHCKSGARSAQAVQLLRDAAPESVRLRSLDGGIDAWSASEHETVQSSGQTAVSGSHHT
ncbi:rhodanese-like domain-containing protein [Brevibacterium sp. UCMA 11754]|uniref:rhodanese-like domain-containing protein n=1 Tax=Brevibacterium sp. UCMA 11754 TaxID=2749198 RepID=UPI003FA44374